MVEILKSIHGNEVGLDADAALVVRSGVIRSRTGISLRFPDGVDNVGTYNFKPSLFPNFRKRVAEVRRGTANCPIVLIGDSTTAGQISGGGTAQQTSGYGPNLAVQLTSAGLTTGWNSTFGNGAITSGDSRVSLSGNFSNAAFGFAYLRQATSAGTMSFTPTVDVDTFDVYYYDDGSMRFSDQVDAGATNSPAATGSAGIKLRTVTTTLGAHTVNLAWITGTVRILAVDAYDSTVKQCSIWNMGISGSTAATRDTKTANYNLGDTLEYAAARAGLCIIDYGINEGRTAYSLSSFKTDIINLVTMVQAQDCDVVLKTPVHDSATYTGSPQSAYVAMMYTIAQEYDLPLIDINARWVSYSAANALSFYSDNVHPTATGYSDIAAAVRSAILAVV